MITRQVNKHSDPVLENQTLFAETHVRLACRGEEKTQETLGSDGDPCARVADFPFKPCEKGASFFFLSFFLTSMGYFFV